MTSEWTCKQVQESMADALGGELAEDRQEPFYRHLAQCGACRRDHASCRSVLEAMASLPGSIPAELSEVGEIILGRRKPRVAPAESVSPPRRSGGRRSGGLWTGGMWRYAAGLLVAFTAGYVFHAATQDSPVPGDFGNNVAQRLTDSDNAVTFQSALAQAHTRQPSRSSLAKVLIAMRPTHIDK